MKLFCVTQPKPGPELAHAVAVYDSPFGAFDEPVKATLIAPWVVVDGVEDVMTGWASWMYTLKAALNAGKPFETLGSVACSWYASPAVSMLQFANDTTPETSVPTQYWERFAPLVPVPEMIASVTGERSVVTRLPLESSTRMIGWVVKGWPAIAPAGETAKTSFSAGPTTGTGGANGSSTMKLFWKLCPFAM